MSTALAHVVEAAYDTEGDDITWLERLLVAAQPFLDRGLGVVGVFYDIADPERPLVHPPVAIGTPAGADTALATLVQNAPPGLFASMVRAVPSCATLSDRLEAIGTDLAAHPLHAGVLAPLGIADFLSVAATEPSGTGCMVGAPLPELTSARDLDGDLWPTLAAHVTAGIRHRKRGAANAAADALPVWASLVAGRWSLVDAFDRGGERFLLAKRTRETPRPTRAALTAREREIVERAASGQSNKVIAYELGIAPSTVAGHLSKAAAKLGASSRVELITTFVRGT